MKLLLDTHILIWALNDDARLSRKARDLILDESNDIYYSIVSLWEVAIKHLSHPEHMRFSALELAQCCEDAGFLSQEIRSNHIFALETLRRREDALSHHDPFDRMLISQAKAEKMFLVTHDSLIPDYEEKCIISV